jgi:hypothetical protein
MEYNVSDLLMSPLATTQGYDLPQGYRLALDEELVAVIEHGRVRLERTTAGIHASGHVSACVSLPCALPRDGRRPRGQRVRRGLRALR